MKRKPTLLPQLQGKLDMQSALREAAELFGGPPRIAFSPHISGPVGFRPVEQGTDAEPLAGAGLYAALYETQFRHLTRPAPC